MASLIPKDQTSGGSAKIPALGIRNNASSSADAPSWSLTSEALVNIQDQIDNLRRALQQDLGDVMAGGGTPLGQIFWRTLDVYDTTLGNDICPHVTVQAAGTARYVTGVLRLAITSDLTVRWNINGAELITVTIPAATPVDTVLSFYMFFSNPFPLVLNGVLDCDITASDNSVDIDGVASFTLIWS